MSKLYEPAFADPHYGIIRPTPTIGYILASGPGTPSGLSLPAAGYAPGCLYINRSGSAGSLLYVNSGSLTSATWTNIA